jgi:hypothetical protein
MGDNAALRKRLNFYKKHLESLKLHQRLRKWMRNRGKSWGPDKLAFKKLPDLVTDDLESDPQSLEKAAKFFGLDHTRSRDLSVLAYILADIIFGSRARGRKKGDKVWNDFRLRALGHVYEEVKRRNPKLSDTKIAQLICQEEEFREYRNNPEPIRQRLPRARQEFWGFMELTFRSLVTGIEPKKDDEITRTNSHANFLGNLTVSQLEQGSKKLRSLADDLDEFFGESSR